MPSMRLALTACYGAVQKDGENEMLPGLVALDQARNEGRTLHGFAQPHVVTCSMHIKHEDKVLPHGEWVKDRFAPCK